MHGEERLVVAHNPVGLLHQRSRRDLIGTMDYSESAHDFDQEIDQILTFLVEP